MNLNLLLERGIGRIMRTAGRFYLSSRAGRDFIAGIIPAIRRGADLRKRHGEEGLQVPAFLIASIASQCNLRCAGCYARAGGSCGGGAPGNDLDTEQWRSIFDQAAGLGVSFVLLAGGEPFLRRDLLELAASFPSLIFPVFTNGTMLDESALRLLDAHRNLIPILSIEGGQEETDSRRGAGTYAKIRRAMESLRERGILFGASVTVTAENMELVTGRGFVEELAVQGCGLTLFVEYVPAEAGTEHLVLESPELEILSERCARLKEEFDSMIILSFPGDEEAMGGCLASGRGFFHINPQGDAEPCPFSPYARQNLRDSTLVEILRSDYFAELRELAACGAHHGGCTLFAQQEQVRQLQLG